MSREHGTSVFPPNVPLPDPPGARFIARIPICIVGICLLLYLLYNVYLEAVDLEIARKPDAFSVAQGGDPSLPVPMISHSGVNDSLRCLECHEPPISEESKKILAPESEVLLDGLPEGYDADFFDDEKFWEKAGMKPRSDSPYDSTSVPVGPFAGDKSCLQCHPMRDFDQQHRGHIFQPFENCTLCHNPHSPVDRSLLGRTYQETCSLCHSPR